MQAASKPKIETVKEIGDGLHAKIYLAREIGNSNKLLCVKVFKREDETHQSLTDSRQQTENEFRVSQIMKDHPNIIRVHSHERDQVIRVDGKEETRDFLTLEYCENSDLFEFMAKYANRQNQQGATGSQGQGMLVKDPLLLKALFLQLIEGIGAMHGKGQVAHMDIKLENVLISQ